MLLNHQATLSNKYIIYRIIVIIIIRISRKYFKCIDCYVT